MPIARPPISLPGYQEKSAAKLLHAYKTLEGIMAGAGILLPPTGQKLRAGRDLAFLSRELVKLKTDAVLGISWKTLQYGA
jgi:DNA polymerase-1